jgi:hypothetical protein
MNYQQFHIYLTIFILELNEQYSIPRSGKTIISLPANTKIIVPKIRHAL